MSRYLKVALLIGAAVSILWIGAFAIGLFLLVDRQVALLLGFKELPVQTYMSWFVGFVTAALAFGLAWSTIDINRMPLKLAIAGVALFETVTLTWVLVLYGLFFPPTAPLLAGCSSLAIGLAFSQSEAGRRKRNLRHALGRRISERAFLQLLNAKQPPALEGEICQVSVLVCEWFGQDAAGAAIAPEEWVGIYNRVARVAADTILGQGGYLDQANGESIRGVFGAPLRMENHAVVACEAAVDLARRLDQLNEMLAAENRPLVDCRIGVNSGEAMAGVLGGDWAAAYTISGDVVEHAHRLCGANLIYGSHIVVGGRTHQLAEHEIEARPLELLRNDLGNEIEEVYELLGRRDQLTPEQAARRDAFWTGVILYRAHRLDEALDHFLQAKPYNGKKDLPLEHYLDRLESLRTPNKLTRWEASRRLNSI